MKRFRERSGTAMPLIVLVALFLDVTSAWASPATVRAGVDIGGEDSDGVSFNPALSANGRFVAFESEASDLVSDDANGIRDVFVRNLRSNVTPRVSVDATGGDANGASTFAAINGNGRFVGFWSHASDLAPGDGNDVADVFVRDLRTGVTTRVSVDAAGGDADAASYDLSISGNGQFVAFESHATDLVVGDGNGAMDVFVRDMKTGITTRASLDLAGGDPDLGSADPSISSNGQQVAFHSAATDLVADDHNGFNDIFVRDRGAGTTVRASVDHAGGDPNSYSADPVMSANGRFVAFESDASDLVRDDRSGRVDIFLRDLVAGATSRASVDVDGGDASDVSARPSLSGDGRYVAFDSFAFDLVEGDGYIPDTFVRDMWSGTTFKVSIDVDGGDADRSRGSAAISADGRVVAFDSPATDLVEDDGNGLGDIFLRFQSAG